MSVRGVPAPPFLGDVNRRIVPAREASQTCEVCEVTHGRISCLPCPVTGPISVLILSFGDLAPPRRRAHSRLRVPAPVRGPPLSRRAAWESSYPPDTPADTYVVVPPGCEVLHAHKAFGITGIIHTEVLDSVDK